MERRKFLKWFGLGAAGAVVASRVAIEVTKDYEYELAEETQPIVGHGWVDQIRERGTIIAYTDKNGIEQFNEAMKQFYAEYPLTPKDAFPPNKTGIFGAVKRRSKFF